MSSKKEPKKVMWEVSERDKKWLEAKLQKKKSDERFFNECWKRRAEVEEDWKRRELLAKAKAKAKTKEAQEKPQDKPHQDNIKKP